MMFGAPAQRNELSKHTRSRLSAIFRPHDLRVEDAVLVRLGQALGDLSGVLQGLDLGGKLAGQAVAVAGAASG